MSNPNPSYSKPVPGSVFVEYIPFNENKSRAKFLDEKARQQCVTGNDMIFILKSLYGLDINEDNVPNEDLSLTTITQRLLDLEQRVDSLETQVDQNTQEIADINNDINDLLSGEKGIGANTYVVDLQSDGTITLTTRNRKKTVLKDTRKGKRSFGLPVQKNSTYLVKTDGVQESVFVIPSADLDQFQTGDTIYFRNQTLKFDSSGSNVVVNNDTTGNLIIAVQSPYRFLSGSNVLNSALTLTPGNAYYGIFERRTIEKPSNGQPLEIKDTPQSNSISLQGTLSEVNSHPTSYLNYN